MTRTLDLGIWQCLTLDPLGQYQSVLHVNSLEFSSQSNGTTSDTPRMSLRKLWQKLDWNRQDWTWDLGICHCLTFELLWQIQSVAYVNCIEFSREFNGNMSDSPKVSLKKLDQNWTGIQSVSHVNSLEFSRKSNGTMSVKIRLFLKKIQPKLGWNHGPLNIPWPRCYNQRIIGVKLWHNRSTTV